MNDGWLPMPDWYVISEAPSGDSLFWPVLAWSPSEQAVQFIYGDQIRTDYWARCSEAGFRLEYRPDKRND